MLKKKKIVYIILLTILVTTVITGCDTIQGTKKCACGSEVESY